MQENFNILFVGGVGEIVEKKSRFIATIEPVDTEEQAAAFIASIKKEHWSATHNCHAFITGEDGRLQRCSDDGEPSGTAGRPMLDVLKGSGIINVCAVVTRYFGGTLLGTGGLVRAYGAAVQEGLKNCTILQKQPGTVLKVTVDYADYPKIEYLAKQMELTVLESEFTDRVTVSYVQKRELIEGFTAQVSERTAGKAKVEVEKEVHFAFHDGNVVM